MMASTRSTSGSEVSVVTAALCKILGVEREPCPAPDGRAGYQHTSACHCTNRLPHATRRTLPGDGSTEQQRHLARAAQPTWRAGPILSRAGSSGWTAAVLASYKSIK